VSRLAKLAESRWLGWLGAFGLFLLSRPYLGVYHDGRLYVADALAKLDPGGVGQDPMFVHDGQFGFSLYTPVLAKLIATLGLSTATLTVVVLTLVLWFAALVVMTERLLGDRPAIVRWAALAFVAVMPAVYGPMDLIRFGEAYATPRGLAEVTGLLGMAAYLSGRRGLALAVCAAGMALHPIMGLCSAAAIGMAMVLEDRRWLWLGLGGVAVAILAGLLRLPMAERLVTVMDPAWRAVVALRSPIVFPAEWTLETWGLMVVQASVLVASAVLLQGAPRRLALGALLAGLLGVAATVVLGERLSLLLILQVQTWRMLQPMAVLSVACLALLASEAPRRGGLFHCGLALLAMAWMFRDFGGLSLALAPLGAACMVAEGRVNLTRPRLIQVLSLGALLAAGLFCLALRGAILRHLLTAMPAARPFSLDYVVRSDFPALLIGVGLGLWLARGGARPPVAVRLITVALVGLTIAALWDDRPPFTRQRDRGPDTNLVAMTAGRPGSVLWLSGDVEPWQLMGRASWASRVQTAGVVFSRPLALEMRARADRLKATGLVQDDWMSPPDYQTAPPPAPGFPSVRAFCSAKDAPAWIVWARWNTAVLDPRLGARDWVPPAPFLQPSKSNWVRADRYAVIPCAG
jgi:hypothetical protein